MAAARRSTHFGMAALYVLQALEADMISLVFTNSSSVVPVLGGRSAFLGSAPLAACPRAAGFDEILMPGEPEFGARTERLETGIPVTPDLVDSLNQEAATAGIVPPAAMAG